METALGSATVANYEASGKIVESCGIICVENRRVSGGGTQDVSECVAMVYRKMSATMVSMIQLVRCHRSSGRRTLTHVVPVDFEQLMRPS